MGDGKEMKIVVRSEEQKAVVDIQHGSMEDILYHIKGIMECDLPVDDIALYDLKTHQFLYRLGDKGGIIHGNEYIVKRRPISVLMMPYHTPSLLYETNYQFNETDFEVLYIDPDSSLLEQFFRIQQQFDICSGDYVCYNVELKEYCSLSMPCEGLRHQPPYHILLIPTSLYLLMDATLFYPGDINAMLMKCSVKHGGTRTTQYKKRFSVLRGQILIYSKSQECNEVSGCVFLPLFNVCWYKRAKRKKLFIIELTRVNYISSLYDYTVRNTSFRFQFKNEAEARRWMSALRKVTFDNLNRTFNIALDLCMTPQMDATIPLVVIHCIRYLMNYLSTEGIFRRSGSQLDVAAMRDKMDAGDDTMLIYQCDDPHTIAGLLKLWMRELPNPLISYECYELFTSAVIRNNQEDLVKALSSLPIQNIVVLAVLLVFFRLVSRFASINLMSVSNVATVIGPNILRPPSLDPLVMMSQAAVENKVMKILLEDHIELYRLARLPDPIGLFRSNIGITSLLDPTDPTVDLLKSDEDGLEIPQSIPVEMPHSLDSIYLEAKKGLSLCNQWLDQIDQISSSLL